MKLSLWNKKQKNSKYFLCIDIGTEAVKTLAVKNNVSGGNIYTSGKKVTVAAASLKYFKHYGLFDGGDFKTDIVKGAVAESVREVVQTLFFQENKKHRSSEKYNMNFPVVFGLPASILRARVVFRSFQRKESKKKISKKEAENITSRVYGEAKKEISQQFLEHNGILPEELHWNSLKVIETNIDGYPVARLAGYSGKKIGFKILATFLPRRYLENTKRIAERLGLKILKIAHTTENLPKLWKDEKMNGIFIDIGGEITQFFILKDGVLNHINEFEGGGKSFSLILSDTLGINVETARDLKERYAKNDLSPDSEKRIKGIMAPEKLIWYNNLRQAMREVKQKSLPSNILLLGGGGLLPEMQEVLVSRAKKEEKDLLVKKLFSVKLLSIKDINNINDLTQKLERPQYIPAALLCSYV